MEPPRPRKIAGRYAVLAEPSCIVRQSRPDVRLFVERGLTVQERDRYRYPPGSIFLDGVYAGPPMLDNVRKHYVLDHHAGVVRPFTLASCEQAAVLIVSGLPLDQGIWQLFVNDPDMDAALASWVLLNHDRLLENGQRRLWDIMPIIRAEGTIDTHGLDMGVLSGLRPRVYHAHTARLDEMRQNELALKKSGAWSSIDPLEYTVDLLAMLDSRMFPAEAQHSVPPSRPQTGRRVEWPSRRVAVLSQGERPIYELERELKLQHGRALALIVLDRGGGRVTLLQVDPFLPVSLNDLYPRLNERDKNADPVKGDLWGGSADIGGSPRGAGTSLSGDEVLDIAAELFSVDRSRLP